MKIRNGFVSNSSSSSFIMIGVDSSLVKNSYEDIKEIDSLYIEAMGIDELVGYVLSDSGEDYLNDGRISISEINKKSEQLVEHLGVNIEDIKIYYGTRPC
jgi:hypothetical protein